MERLCYLSSVTVHGFSDIQLRLCLKSSRSYHFNIWLFPYLKGQDVLLTMDPGYPCSRGKRSNGTLRTLGEGSSSPLVGMQLIECPSIKFRKKL